MNQLDKSLITVDIATAGERIIINQQRHDVYEAQMAAISALQNMDYYFEKINETYLLKADFVKALRAIGIDKIIEGVANFILIELPLGISKKLFLDQCINDNLYLRDVSNMGNELSERAIRIAIKDKVVNEKMIRIIDKVLRLNSIKNTHHHLHSC